MLQAKLKTIYRTKQDDYKEIVQIKMDKKTATTLREYLYTLCDEPDEVLALWEVLETLEGI